jgi:hypothetical protein
LWREEDAREEICWQEEHQEAFQWARDAIRVFSGAEPPGDQVPAICDNPLCCLAERGGW